MDNIVLLPRPKRPNLEFSMVWVFGGALAFWTAVVWAAIQFGGLFHG